MRHMKTIAAAFALIATAPLAALADGMPRAPAAAPPGYSYPAPEQLFYNWGGVYVGGQIGAANSSEKGTFLSTGTEAMTAQAADFVVGGQAGLQFQIRDIVFGVEYSYSFLNSKLSTPLTSGYTVATKLKDVQLISGRLGYAYQNYMFFIKGGYATSNIDLATSGTGTANASANGNGWVGGLGVHYAITPNIILGAEYDYVKLNIGNTTLDVNSSVPRNNIDTQMGLLRLDFKFGG